MDKRFTRIDQLNAGDVIKFAINNVYTVVSIVPKKQRKGANPRLVMTYRYLNTGEVLVNDFVPHAICELVKKAAKND
jgi:hypothetical protein